MLKQRTINLTEDEVLIIKAAFMPEERAEVRILSDDLERLHIFITERPFAALHVNASREEITTILHSTGEQT